MTASETVIAVLATLLIPLAIVAIAGSLAWRALFAGA